MQGLLSIIEKYQFDIVAFTIDLKELAEHVPAARPSPRTFAHVLLLLYIMQGISDGSLKNNRNALITLIHDRGANDSVLLDAYNILAKNPILFPGAGRFCSIRSMGWEDCIALQQADLLAYENYKESRRDPEIRGRRKSLEWILERGKVGGFLKSFNEQALLEISQWFDQQSDEFRIGSAGR